MERWKPVGLQRHLSETMSTLLMFAWKMTDESQVGFMRYSQVIHEIFFYCKSMEDAGERRQAKHIDVNFREIKRFAFEWIGGKFSIQLGGAFAYQ